MENDFFEFNFETPSQRRRRQTRERMQRFRNRAREQERDSNRSIPDQAREQERNSNRLIPEPSGSMPRSSPESSTEHYCGAMDVECSFCRSKNFLRERPTDGFFNSCCRKGRIKLPKLTDDEGNLLEYPTFSKNLLKDAHFRKEIRSYNSALSFASLGAKVQEFRGNGHYVFKVHGQVSLDLS